MFNMRYSQKQSRLKKVKRFIYTICTPAEWGEIVAWEFSRQRPQSRTRCHDCKLKKSKIKHQNMNFALPIMSKRKQSFINYVWRNFSLLTKMVQIVFWRQRGEWNISFAKYAFNRGSSTQKLFNNICGHLLLKKRFISFRRPAKLTIFSESPILWQISNPMRKFWFSF